MDSNYYYDPSDYYRQMNDTQLVADIQKAINGEYSAVMCYQKLADLSPDQTEREQILEIQQDERRHFETFSGIYMNLTGMQPSPQLIEECPDTYLEGLEFSFRDEQEAVDFYLDIADKAQDPYIKESFQRAAKDEQNHAVWFLFFFQNNRG